jgi:IPT/TIG domain
MTTVLFKDPNDYLGLRGRKLKKLFLGTLVIGALSLGLWHKFEQIATGQQRAVSYVSQPHQTRPDVVLSVTVFFTSGTSFNRDTVLPGWSSAGTIDCIGGGAGGVNGGGGSAGGGGGGGGGAWVRSNNLALPATVTYAVGAAGGANQNGGSTSFNGGTVVAAGGSTGSGVNPGSGGNTWTGNVNAAAGGNGGSGFLRAAAGAGGGGGCGGPSGAGRSGAAANQTIGGVGGAGDAGAGGAGGSADTVAAGNGGNGGGGNEWGSGFGCGGGGGGGGAVGGAGGAGGGYGAGGGGGGSSSPAGSGFQGFIAATYTPLPAPTVGGCSPTSGFTQGGTPVTITGTNFANSTGVTFGGIAATSVVVVNATTITCVSPPHAPGLVSVTVTSSGGSASGNLFTYLQPASGFNMPMLGF